MGKLLDVKKLEMEIKKETNPSKKRMLEKDLVMAKRDQTKRMKDFEALAKSKGPALPKMEKMVTQEPDKLQQKKMHSMLDRLKKDHIAEMKKVGAVPGTAAATPQMKNKHAVDQKKRKATFDNIAKKKPEDTKILTKLMKAEPDKPTQKMMAQTIKKIEIENKKRESMKSTGPAAAASSPATPRPGAANAKADEKAALDRLKKFEKDAQRIKNEVEIKKLDKIARMEKDPKIKNKMSQLIKKVQKTVKP